MRCRSCMKTGQHRPEGNEPLHSAGRTKRIECILGVEPVEVLPDPKAATVELAIDEGQRLWRRHTGAPCQPGGLGCVALALTPRPANGKFHQAMPLRGFNQPSFVAVAPCETRWWLKRDLADGGANGVSNRVGGTDR